jgi:flagellar protein FlaG
MQNSIGTVAATSDPAAGQTAPAPRRAEAPPAPERVAPAAPQADLRLVIEEDAVSGSYIYKTVNRATGEVVLQLPRDDVLKLRDAMSYAAGDVIRTKV